MAYETRSGRGVKDDESDDSERKYGNGKAFPTSVDTTDTSALRRSARGRITKSTSAIRKSGRFEKSGPTTSPVKKKSETIQKQTMLSPLRRSDRVKNCTPSSSSGSKNSGEFSSSLGMKRRQDRNKSVKELTEETGDACRIDKRDLESATMKRKIMSGRTYKALFRKQRRRFSTSDCNDEELEKSDMSSKDDNRDERVSGFKLEEDADKEIDKCNGKTREQCNPIASEKSLQNQVGLKLSCSENTEELHEPLDGDKMKPSKSYGVVKEIAQNKELPPDDYASGMPQTSELVNRSPIGRSFDCDTNMDSDNPATLTRKAVSTHVADSVASTSGHGQQDLFGMCIECSKSRRVGIDTQKKELCSCNLTLDNGFGNKSKDREEPEADVALQHVEKQSGCSQPQEASLDDQMDWQKNVCLICKFGGKLLCCNGKCCNRCYHLSCLDPPLNDVPLGVWHCLWCTKKKVECGVHLVSRGIDSIWDVREVEISEAEGLRRQKQYLVKYKGLAHVHNHWVAEPHLLIEIPTLVSKFNQKNQVTNWNAEWAVPHRLLKKRLLRFPKQQNKHADNVSDCHYEWLVKWHGLDYEHATWELENAPFLHSPHGQNLIQKYENRCEKAQRAAELIDKSRNGSLFKLSKLPVQPSPGTEDNLLNCINKLLKCWHKRQHAIVFDEQERVMKVILFILSLREAHFPFIVITASCTLSYWEAEFMRLAPSVDVVIYSGSKAARKALRTMEFQDEGGCLMLHVLLSSPEAIVEDLEMLGTLKWDAVIIDECQLSRISSHLEQIKMLITDLRILLFNGRLKDTVAEYLNLLSLLDSPGGLSTCDGLKSDMKDNDIDKLKARLSQFIAYDCKFDPSRFVEYWVPIQISNVQLEQYCATLLANHILLCSSSKIDHIGALPDILLSTRKCCDHPYIMDPSLQGLITKDLPMDEYLDVGIKASGKLQLINMMLSEIKNRQLKVLILFQSISGPGRVSIGDILDDFLRQRFGPDSYERVDGGGVIPSKKQAALNRFNNEAARFMLLLENRACLPSIRLLFVDAVIIFDSDWNPANDLRALHRISIESQSKQIKIFRLYSFCTVEEKLLILAKNNISLDSNLQNISRSSCDTLLMWGASNLFTRLEEFHSNNELGCCINILSEESLLTDVFAEFLAILSQCGKDNYISNSIISKVRHSGTTFIPNIPLLGEGKIQLSQEQSPHFFWAKLLREKYPRWKFLQGLTQRNRKRVHYNEESPKKQVLESHEVGKKRKKVINNSVDQSPLHPHNEKVEGANFKEGNAGISADYWSPSLPRPTSKADKPSDVLKLGISKLCELLKFPEDVEVMVGRFFDYVVMNHRVNEEPATLLQAFQISMCWIGASLSKQKIDRKTTLELAKKHLNFCCKEEEANSIFLRLRSMKKNFVNEKGNIKELDPSEDSMEETLGIRTSQPLAFNWKNVKVETVERSYDEWLLSQQDRELDISMEKNDKTKNVRKVKKICKKRMKKLLKKQEDEIHEFHTSWEEKRIQLETDHKLESAVVRSIHSDPTRIDRLKMLEDEFAKKLDEFRCQKDIQLKELCMKQLAEKIEEKQKADSWLNEVRCSPSQNQAHDELPLQIPESCNQEGDLNNEHRADGGSDDHVYVSEQLIEEHPDGNSHYVQARVTDIAETCLDRIVNCVISTVPASIPMNQSINIDEAEKITSMRQLVYIVGQKNEITVSADSMKSHTSEEGLADRVLSDNQDKEVQLKFPEAGPSAVIEKIHFMKLTTDAESNGETVRVGTLSPDMSHAVVSQDDGTNTHIDGESSHKELPVISTLSKPVVSSTCNSTLPSNTVVLHECSQSLPAQIQNESEPVGERSIMQQVEVLSLPIVTIDPCEESQTSTSMDLPIRCGQFPIGVSDLPGNSISEIQNEGAIVGEKSIMQQVEVPSLPTVTIDPCEEFQPSSSMDLPIHGQPPGGVADHSCGNTLSENSLAPQLVENIAHQAVNQTRCDLNFHPLDGATILLGQNQCDLRFASGENNQPCAEQGTCFPNVVASPQVLENNAEIPNQTILHSPAGGLVNQPCSTPNFTQNDFSTQFVEDLASDSLQADFDSGVVFEVDPSIDRTELTRDQNQPDLRSASGDNLPSAELSTSPNDSGLPQVIETAAISNQTILQTVTSLAVTQGPSNHPLHTAHQGAYRMPTLPFVADPLQIELERIHKEKERAVKVHEDMKLQLKSECDKELEELVAQVRHKYEAKLKDAEAEFVLKTNELDKNQNKVLMNKILAKVFWSKCLNHKPSRSMRMLQDTDLHQLPMPYSVRPFSGFYSTSRPAASQQNTTSSLPVHHPAAPSTITHCRPPNISPITPSKSNLRTSTDIRTPAPHLQPFRPSASIAANNPTSLPWGMSTLQAARSLTSLSPPLLQPHPAVPQVQPSTLPTNLTGSFIRPPADCAGRVDVCNHPNASQPSVLNPITNNILDGVDVCNHPNASQPSVLNPITNNILDVDSLILANFEKSGPVQNSLTSSSAGADVVCLSDDD